MKKLTLVKRSIIVCCVGFITVSCSDDNDSDVLQSQQPDEQAKDVFMIVTSGDPENDLVAGVGMKVYSDILLPRYNETVYNDESALKVPDTFTQLTYNENTSTLTGYIYARGAASVENGGIGSSTAGLRSYKLTNQELSEIGEPVVVASFGNTGIFGNYSYAAQISNPFAMVVGNNNDIISSNNIAVNLPSIAINETTPTFSNIVDMGNNQVAVVVNYSDQDLAAVAFTDYSLNIDSQKFITDERIGSSVGAMRSVRYTQSAADENGNVYIFSGSSSDDSKVGAIRIKSGTKSFDTDYHFDILAQSDGYRFRKAFYISDDYFLLEFFTNKGAYGNMAESGLMAVVKMSDKSFKWVSGLPNPSVYSFSIGWGDGYDGVFYLPLAAATSMSSSSGTTALDHPTIYAIDAATGVATSLMTFEKNELLKSVNIVK